MTTSDRPIDAAITTGVVVQGNIAARIDRLPLTRVQYLLAGITQVYWGLLIDTDGIVARLYPFVWEPVGITTFQYSLLYAANTGAGILVGQYVGGPLSDRFGRKKVLVASALVDAMFLWPLAHTNVFGWLLLFNFLYGIGLGLMLATNNVYLQEIAPAHSRHKLAMRAQLITAVCGLLPGVLGLLFVPDNYQWFIYVLVMAQLALTPIGLFVLPESPRWLEQKGRVAGADAIVSRWESKIEARTGQPLPEPHVELNPVVQTEKVPVGELFRGQYRQRTTLLLAVWILGYAGLIYGFGGFVPVYLADSGWSSDDVFLWLSIVGSVVRVFAFFAFSYLTRYEPKNMIPTLAVSWVVIVSLLLVTDVFPLQVLIIIFSGPLSTLWLFMMYNYTSVSFPTRVRSAGYGWTNGVGHTAAVWAPLIIGPLFAATAANGHWGWFAWVTIPGALIPALLIWKWGGRQRGRTLEEVST